MPCHAEGFGDKAADFFDGLDVELGVADDAAFGDVFAAEFELRFDQADHAAVLIQYREHRRKDIGERNEGQIHHREMHFFADVLRRHEAGVELFFDDHAWVVAQFPDQLVGADIHGMDAGGAALQQAVGEATGGSADIDADPAVGVDGEGIESAFEFESAAADEAGFLFDLEWGIEWQLGAGFVDDAVAAADFAGEDQAFRLFA